MEQETLCPIHKIAYSSSAKDCPKCLEEAVKAKETCSACHDHATTMQQGEGFLYCPACGHRSPTPQNSSSVDETYARAVGEAELLASLTREYGPGWQWSIPPNLLCDIYNIADGSVIQGLPQRFYPDTKLFWRPTPVFQATGHPPQESIDGLLVSADAVHYHLIPPIAIERLARRFMLGEVRKGKGAWNAASTNQDVLKSKAALIRRLGHVVGHAYALIGKVLSDADFSIDDDAAAIAWGGCYAISATDAITKERKEV